MKKKVLALVLARKNSTRLKNKNILKFKDKPLIQWTFDNLYKKNIRKLFTDVLVSTDSKEIINLSKKYKYLAPWMRPKKLSTKLSSSESSALHAIKWYEKNIQKVDGLFLFQPTTPFRIDNKIILAIRLFSKSNKQIVSVCGKKTYKFIKNEVNGSMYLSPVNILKKFKTFTKRGFVALKMFRAIENIDIDTQDDFNIAKKIFNNSKKNLKELRL
jgi:CMP-N,N'-diacetyllegionaminic acid synthase